MSKTSTSVRPLDSERKLHQTSSAKFGKSARKQAEIQFQKSDLRKKVAFFTATISEGFYHRAFPQF